MSAVAAAPPGSLSLKEFFDEVRGGRLVVQRCAGCGELAVPPKVNCAACHGRAWERLPLAGDGEVASYTVIRVPPGALQAEAPYPIAIVRMREGVSLLGRTEGVAPEGLSIGLPVRFAGARSGGDGTPVIVFAPRS